MSEIEKLIERLERRTGNYDEGVLVSAPDHDALDAVSEICRLRAALATAEAAIADKDGTIEILRESEARWIARLSVVRHATGDNAKMMLGEFTAWFERRWNELVAAETERDKVLHDRDELAVAHKHAVFHYEAAQARAAALLDVIRGAKVAIGMMERPAGAGSVVNGGLDRRIAAIDAALSEAEAACPGHVASAIDPKICGRCGVHIDSLRPDDGDGDVQG